MSCPLYIAASFSEYSDDTDYIQGDIRAVSENVFICIAPYTSAVAETMNLEYWRNMRDLPYTLIYDVWESEDFKDYKQFEVVSASDILYMALKDHTNSTLDTDVTDVEFWIVVNEDCLLSETYSPAEENYVDGAAYNRGQSVIQDDTAYAFLGNDNDISQETPGTNSTIETGKQWENIQDSIDLVDTTADKTQNTYNATTIYAKNDKVESGDAYYVSTHDGNQDRIPEASSSWQFAHPKTPLPSTDEEADWIAGSYDWGTRVKYNDVSYLSDTYENTTTPGLDLSWKPIEVRPISSCVGQRASVWSAYLSYNQNQVVIFTGLKYISTKDNNTSHPTTSDWTLCPDQVVQDCGVNSSGFWRGDLFYNTNAVVQVDTSYYIALMPSLNTYPPGSRQWQVCSNSGTSCEDENTVVWDEIGTWAIDETVYRGGSVYISLIADNQNNDPLFSDTWLKCKKGPNDTALHLITDNSYETLVYSETLQAFDQFFDFKSALYMEINGKGYSYSKDLDEYVHQGGEPGKFHDDNPETMVVRIVVNDHKSLRKVFDHIMTQADTDEIKFDKVTVRTNFAESGTQIINKSDHTYKLREGVHTMPARGLVDVTRMKGNWMEVTYEITGVNGDPHIFRFVGSDYLMRISPRR